MQKDNALRMHDRLAAPSSSPATAPSAAPTARAPTRQPAQARQSASISVWLFTAATLAALAYGLYLAHIEEFTPKEGAGYWIGITGGSLMLFLLAYPLRKRIRFLSRAGSAPAWFRAHMILGIVGPVLILYHCNFSFGATNSNVALIAMLLVSGSGVLGRYIYGKVHNGLYGARSNLNELLAQATSLIPTIESEVGGAGGSVAVQLSKFGESALLHRSSFWASVANVVYLWFTVPFARSRIRRAANAAAKQNAKVGNWSRREKAKNLRMARAHIDEFLRSVVKAAELGFYERLFSLWHVLHVPLFFLLIITGITHVVAVHLY